MRDRTQNRDSLKQRGALADHMLALNDDHTAIRLSAWHFDLLSALERIALFFSDPDGADIPNIPFVDLGSEANTERTRR
jgi:hypothetical protein